MLNSKESYQLKVNKQLFLLVKRTPNQLYIQPIIYSVAITCPRKEQMELPLNVIL